MYQTFSVLAKITLVVFVISCTAKSENIISLPPHLQPLNAFVGLGGGKSKECTHSNITFGTQVAGALQTFVEITRKDKSLLSKNKVEVQYPSGSTTNKCNITFIKVDNLLKSCKCFGENVNIIEGGVGHKNVKISITSEKNCPIEHKVSCFTKC